MKKSKGFIVLMLFLGSILPVIQPVNAQENFWKEAAPIQPKFYRTLGAAVVNGSIYFFGVNINEQYDPQNNTWTSKTPSPISFDYECAAIAVCQNKIYAIGGRVTMAYDPATDTWENKTAMPRERYTKNANVVNGKIYVISGQLLSGLGIILASSANEVYDPETDSWTELEPIPTPVISYASAVLDDKIYIIGGNDGDRDRLALTLVQIYDPKTNQWTEGTPLEEAVVGGEAITTTGLLAPKRIYVIGGNIIIAGNNYVRYSDHNQIYDPQTESWSFGAQTPTGRNDLALANVNDIIYALGGTNKSVSVMVGAGASQEEWEAAYDKIASMRTHANERYFPVGYEGDVPMLTPNSPTQTENQTAPPTTSPSTPDFPSLIPVLPPPSQIETQNQIIQPTTSSNPDFLPWISMLLLVVIIALAAAVFKRRFCSRQQNTNANLPSS